MIEPSQPAQPADGPGRAPSRRRLSMVRLVAVALTGVVIAVGVLLVADRFLRRETTETRTFAGGEVGAVQVGEDVRDVRVRVAEPGEEPRVTARITDSFGEGGWSAQLSKLSGHTLFVRGACGRGGGVWFLDCEVDLTLVVPAGIPVDVEANTGDVSVEGAFSGIRAQTTTGDVLLRGVTGPVQIRTDAGDVRSLATMARTVSARTTTGDIRLTFDAVPRDVSTVTTTGDVTVLVPDNGNRITGAFFVTPLRRHGRGFRYAPGGPGVQIDVRKNVYAKNEVTMQTETGDLRLSYR